jgi:hypothetical protein
MTQLSPYTIVYDQIAKAVAVLYERWNKGQYVTKQDLLKDFNDILSQLYNNVGMVNAKVDQYIKGEPPSSKKYNSFIASLRDDLNIATKQTDYLNAKVIETFNLMTSELESEKQYLNRIFSKTKILQMYSQSPADDIIYVGDSFDNTDFIDTTKYVTGSIPLVSNGQAILPILKRDSWPAATISINKSNGFIGNNHLAVRKENIVDGDNYSYAWEESASFSEKRNIIDQNPLTVFEYEAIKVAQDSLSSVRSNDEFCYIVDDETLVNGARGSLVNWSNHNLSNPLVLDFTISSPVATKANNIIITPFFGYSKVVSIESIIITLSDGTEKELLNDSVYVGLSPEFFNNQSSKNYFLNKATIYFEEQEITQARIKMSQTQSNQVDIIHTFWSTDYQSGSPADNSPFYGSVRFNPKAVDEQTYREVRFDQMAITPMLTKPNSFKAGKVNNKSISVTTIKKGTGSGLTNSYNIPIKIQREVLKAHRMSIGLRDVSLGYDVYSNYAEVTSLPFTFDLPVESVILNIESNEGTFTTTDTLISAEISVDGKTWIPIDAVQSGFSGSGDNVPEVIAFNQTVPTGYKLPGVSYYSHPDIPLQVKSLIVKLKIRKNSSSNITPALYSYTLGVKVKKS